MTPPDISGIGMTSQRTRERLVQRLCEQGITNFEVLEVMRNAPRHLFLDEAMAHRAYEDTALPIGYQQTLSQPLTVARMTEILLANGPRKRVLEIGTGSGFQTYVLSQLVDEVFSVERIKPLLLKAKTRLRSLRVWNAQCRHADGMMGWADKGPFDGILVAAAGEYVPEQLLAQLSDGGRLIMPVGKEKQQLHLVIREGDDWVQEILDSVFFVPLLPGSVR
jgi:protein-L-isoaspartate(D-aspartate) O-methyltransferase